MWISKRQKRVNFPILFKILGWLLMIEAGFMGIPSIVSLCYHEADWVEIGICSLFTFMVGFLLNHCIHPAYKSMGKREGFLLTAMIWVVFSLFGMLPFIFCRTPLSVSDAFFESMAGFTTTGSSSYVDIDVLGHGINIWRALMQWIGGMGIILFTLAVLPMLNHSGGMQMFNAEVTGITHEKTKPRISSTAKSLWMVYIALTFLCAFFLWLGPMDLYDSIGHAFGILSTGGFSTRAQGIRLWDSVYVDTVVTIFMFLGGASFTLIYFAVHGKFKPLRENLTLKVYIWVILVSFVILAVSLLINGNAQNIRETISYPLFQVVSVLTSTGYVIPTLPQWGALSAILMVILSFCGACAGSTSGGAKLDRMIVLFKSMRNSVKKAYQPNQITQVVVNHSVLAPQLVAKSVSYICIFVILIFLGAVLLCAVNVPMPDSIFVAMACMANTGLNGSDIGLTSCYAQIPAFGKYVLCALMLIGRLEVFTILLLFTSSFWRK